jgi:hypothetical protein
MHQTNLRTRLAECVKTVSSTISAGWAVLKNVFNNDHQNINNAEQNNACYVMPHFS